MCSRAYKRAVQGVVWDSKNPNVFLSCGQGGYLKFWDTHDPFAPLYSHMAGGGASVAALLMSLCASLLTSWRATQDGSWT
jgi:hypothetical protein